MLNPSKYPHFLEKRSISLHKGNAECFIFEEVSSTFDVAYKLIKEEKFPEWSSVLAYSQSSGRGQLGHKWASPKGNLSATVRLPKGSFLDCDATAPILGVIIIQFLKNFFEKEKKNNSFNFNLKWTNDLVINSQNNYYKVGGMLVEERDNALFLGLGINVNVKPCFSQDNNLNPLSVCHLSEFFECNTLDIFTLWLRLVHFINLCYIAQSSNKEILASANVFEKLNLSNHFQIQQGFLQEANKYLAFVGREVIITHALPSSEFDYANDGTQITEYSGILCGISLEQSSLGGLIIDTHYGRKTFLSGTVRQA